MIEVRCDNMLEIKGVSKKCNRLLMTVSRAGVDILTKCPKCKKMSFKTVVEKKKVIE